MLPITYIEVRFCAHATENVDKVMQAAQNLLPSEHIEDIIFKRRKLEGHYGNPIIFFDTRIRCKETVRALVKNLSAKLSSSNKEELSRTINRCVDKGSIYIRLDKQAALKGKTKFAKSDPIRIRIRFRKNKNKDVIEICREMGMTI